MREDKRGKIPDSLPPILERLGVAADTIGKWVAGALDYIERKASQLNTPPALVRAAKALA